MMLVGGQPPIDKEKKETKLEHDKIFWTKLKLKLNVKDKKCIFS